MRITLLFIMTISWHRSGIRAQQCGKPEVTRTPVYVYRRIEEFKVKVNRCLFNDTKHAYSDITENCMNAFKTGIFKDKLKHDNQLRNRGSPIVLEEYITIADRIKNKIKLRSGAVCRYDRGFCFDPSETINYAVVWNVVYKQLQACPTRLELVFSGYVDIWNFHQENLKYLVYYNEDNDMAFYLKIVEETNCGNKNLMITEGNSFIISQQKLDSFLYSTSVKIYQFPLDSKGKISEAIMKNCDLQQYPLDFTNRIGEDYLKESKNIKTILENYQELITGLKIDVKKCSSGIIGGDNSKPLNAISRNLTNLEALVNIQVNVINAIRSSLKNLEHMVGGMNKMEDLNKTLTIIQELQLEDRRVIEKIDDEHEALKNLEQKFSDLDTSVKREKSMYLTRIEFSKELSRLQREINSKFQIFINKMDLVLKEHVNWRNNNSQIQRDFADRYDESLKKMESQFKDLSELFENVKTQLYSKINAINVSIINNITLIKNKLGMIEHNIPDIQSLLAKWHKTDKNFVNIEKDLQNHKNNFSIIMKLGKTYVKNIQTNVSSIHLISLKNKLSISEMKIQFEKLLKKLSDIDWDIVKALKHDSKSREEFQNIIIGFQRQYDKKLETLNNNLALALKQYKIGWSLEYSDLKNEIRKNTENLLAEMTTKNNDNAKELVDDLKKRIHSELFDIKQSAFNNFSIINIDLNKIKFNISNNTKLILERLNGARTDISNINTELSKFKLDSTGTVRFGEEKLKDIQKNTTNINNIVLNFGKDIYKIGEQLTGMKKEFFDVDRKLNERIDEYFEGSKQTFEDSFKRVDVQVTIMEQSTFRNLSLLKRELNSIQQDILINHKPIIARVDDIEIAVEKLKLALEKHDNNSNSNLGVSKSELKNIRDIFIETKKLSMNNEGEVSELKFDLDELANKLKGIHKISLEYTLNMKTLSESLKLREKDISNIFPQLVHFRGVIDEIKSKEMDTEDKIHNFDLAIKQIDKKLIKNVEVSDKIGKHTIEIDNLKNQIKTLGTNLMNGGEENENILIVIKQNMSNIFTTLQNREADTSDLKSRIQGLFVKFDENKKLIEDSKGECMNYVNSRMRSVTEEIAQIHNLILKKGEEIRNVQAQINEKASACCEETRKEIDEKDARINQLTENLEKVMKQVRYNDERLSKINKLIEDNANVIPESA